jgi:hypothetical protein
MVAAVDRIRAPKASAWRKKKGLKGTRTHNLIVRWWMSTT